MSDEYTDIVHECCERATEYAEVIQRTKNELVILRAHVTDTAWPAIWSILSEATDL